MRYRDCNCNTLRKEDCGKKVRLAGWVRNKRDHGGVLFIDLRDQYGLTQVVFQDDSFVFSKAEGLKRESVIMVEGTVSARTRENINPGMTTGEIEILCTDMQTLSPARNLPFQVFPEEQVSEELQLKYRFLALRQESLKQNILLRSKVMQTVRTFFHDRGFTEINTPILTASSPEGARDYLVPSRVHPGCFYALPQAPQQYKQILMTSGFDKYFQIAPCFRDEDARANRSPGEFYQIDLEMAFAAQDDIFTVTEQLMETVFSVYSNNRRNKPPYPRIPYQKALSKYGCDKPDLRNPLFMEDLSGIFINTGPDFMVNAIANGGEIRCIRLASCAEQPRSFFDKLQAGCISQGLAGMPWISLRADSIKGSAAKIIDKALLEKTVQACNAEKGDSILFLVGKAQMVNRTGAFLINKLGNDLNLIDPETFAFCWITDYPMFEQDPQTGKLDFLHNPFSMPRGGYQSLLDENPLQITAWQYDIVCNGIELSSGAIRNHDPETLLKAFEMVGYSREETEQKFAGILKAFRCGTPPHGGIAPGLDRLLMLLCGSENLREVIAFPMNQKAQDLLVGAPARVYNDQLKELHLEIRDDFSD